VRRAFVVVIDACGAGALPDARDYGDEGANTLGHLARSEHGLALPALERLGLGSILPLEGVPPAPAPVLHGRLHPLGPGKDSTTGHWELMGVVIPRPLPTYPGGFPDEVIAIVTAASGRGVVCNRPYNGIGAIDDYGQNHLDSGDLIVYTSQDSVLQIAAHTELVPPDELYAICERVRAELPDRHAVGRIIARPFAGAGGRFERTGDATTRSRRPRTAIWRSSPIEGSRCTRSASRGSCSPASGSGPSIRGLRTSWRWLRRPS
jgi:phosphopentomutase